MQNSERTIPSFPRVQGLESEYFSGAEGWSAAIFGAAREINAALAGCGQTVAVVDQLKEKFGTLRFYASLREADEPVRDLPDLPEYRGCGAFDAEHALDYADLAEEASSFMCMSCSAPATAGGQGWINTLCGPCRKERMDPHAPRAPKTPHAQSLEPAHFLSLAALRQYTMRARWLSACANARAAGKPEPAPEQYGADPEPGVVLGMLQKCHDFAAKPADPLGPSGLTLFHYPLPEEFLALCDQAGLIGAIPDFMGQSPEQIACSLEQHGAAAFWQKRALARCAAAGFPAAGKSI